MTKSKTDRPRVLLVDDYPDAREMYSEYLEFSGFDVVEAANGMEALQRAADAQPDIILMDLSLPVMDGWEATRRLKADERTAHIPVVALTGHALAGISEGREARPAATRSSPSRVCPRISSRRSGRCSMSTQSVGEEGPQERKICENHQLARARRSGRAALPPLKAKAKGARRGAAGAAGRRSRNGPRRGNGRTASRSAARAPKRDRAAGRAPRSQAADAVPIGGSRGKYVYCIIEATDPLKFGPIGIGAEPSEVYTVHYRDLAAVVSDAPLEVLDSTRENVLAHERVNETVMREHTVIPMSFGTIFKTREDIVELLRSAAEAFGDVLNKMQNKLEFGLKVLWDRDQAIREIESDDEDISRLKKEISGAERPDLLRAHAVRPAGRCGAAVAIGALRVGDPRRAARRVGRLAHQQADWRQDDHERRVPDLARQGDGVRRQGQVDRQPFDKLTFKYTGPWPPYNFVNIRLKLERA